MREGGPGAKKQRFGITQARRSESRHPTWGSMGHSWSQRYLVDPTQFYFT